MSLANFLRENRAQLSAGVLLTFSSSYGQTYFIALFAAQIMAAYNLTDGQWGGIYTLSTTASAIVMFWAGALTDNYRVRTLAWGVIPGLALVCLAMAANTTIIGLILIIFLLRFLGQGMMSQFATVSMARWFTGRRGLALSISAMGFALGQAFVPVIVAALFSVLEWRWIWIISAVVMLATFPVILRLLAAERTPQSLAEQSTSTGMNGRHWTRPDVLRSPIFWLMVPMLLGPPSWGTALFFQQVHIADVKGWALLDYLSLIPLLTVVGIAVTLTSGQLIDKVGSGRIIRFYMVPWMIGFVLLAAADTLFAAAISFLFFGVGTGLQATVITTFWAEFFGTKHIGAIKAVSTSVMVFGSAIGPGITGALIDFGYTFPEQMLGIAVYFFGAGLLVWIALTRATRALGSA
ncbi:MFS transporter [Boseongicola aestuarii]|uniref:Putative MFS-type transporter YhjX n=1 Tax=Boseongicola aestuarii TaxID=1470561 RepID=A0A238J3T0_9RHOB|nr:MFS transporter [Boseongicola aestuarii]SMX24993.1 putative MFS-type transporter YhjX [Boseongicola aestuarii]